MVTQTKIIAIAALLVSMQWIGCSRAGYMAVLSDSNSSIGTGAFVSVTEKDGERFSGDYEGIDTLPLPLYARDYYQDLVAYPDARLLPVLGEHVSISTALDPEKLWNGRFLGFDDDYVWLKTDGGPVPMKFYFESVYSIVRSDGGLVQRMNMRRLMQEGHIPMRSAIVLKDGDSTTEVPLDAVRRIAFLDDPGHTKARVFASSVHNNAQIMAKVVSLPF